MTLTEAPMGASGCAPCVLSNADTRRLPLSDDVVRSLVVSQTHEPRVTQMVLPGPFDEFELPHELRFQPAAIDHLLRRQAGTPSSALRSAQIRERTGSDFEKLKPLRQILAQPRSESIASPCRVEQLPVLVVAEDERVERRATDRVPANDELLPPVDTHLQPGARSLPRLVPAVPAFRDQSFESLRLDRVSPGRSASRPASCRA